ncbi:uncharacterized protein BDV17DRAFT_9027 [Aspergillus undulatus]|uniref:uncharacterized protein n=1 Tax=Aspergillus undulatus TaxID=1810928 RepID=UPI003CCCCF9F
MTVTRTHPSQPPQSGSDRRADDSMRLASHKLGFEYNCAARRQDSLASGPQSHGFGFTGRAMVCLSRSLRTGARLGYIQSTRPCLRLLRYTLVVCNIYIPIHLPIYSIVRVCGGPL